MLRGVSLDEVARGRVSQAEKVLEVGGGRWCKFGQTYTLANLLPQTRQGNGFSCVSCRESVSLLVSHSRAGWMDGYVRVRTCRLRWSSLENARWQCEHWKGVGLLSPAFSPAWSGITRKPDGQEVGLLKATGEPRSFEVKLDDAAEIVVDVGENVVAELAMPHGWWGSCQLNPDGLAR